ncbi:MAG: ABC transporter permease [Chloroflexi bacterium RIFOXYC12_FULL_59_14]|nr:MAG: ABC transporter permease [Chloroflexi bacterium RBG_16_58_14]OGO75821.1 MAG: ABC transporter permease [Chloroflexi bacterium RIFOXYC12_FULL_59_14]OGO80524.1 MAG: ABC transporter permease [Chloroflexi bacterium RIFOXYD12_FULL_57_15]
MQYSAVRLITLFATVIVAIYLTVMIANMGGFVDQIMRGEMRERITVQVVNNPANRNLDQEARNQLVLDKIALEEKRLGLNQPYAVRSLRYLTNALTLNLGRANNMTSDSGSKTVRLIILERLPATLLLMGTSNLILFFGAILLALSLSRKYGSFWDKAVIAMSPTSSVPPWFYGIFLILIFAAVLKVLPFGGMVDAPPPKGTISYALSVLKHLTLPASALIMSSLFLSIYNWRTFFLIYSSEDYVEMAKAKGLPSRDIERRYILRPTLPTIITNFALLLIGLWTGAIITETVFLWPGLGRTLFRAIGLYDIPVIVGSTIIYAYLLAITVFLLDFFYALVDPRVKIGGGGA